MRKVLKWILTISGLLIIIALCMVAAGYAFISRTIPADNGMVQIAGLGENIKIVRDKEAIPHIIGKSIIDVVAAQGFIHAQDRLWQMENFRMAGQGRLSEMFGEQTLDTDKFLRTINLAEYSKNSFEKLAPQTKKILQAYARGINAYIDRERRIFEPALPPEFIILGHQPEPWQAWHSLMTIKIMALTLGGNMAKEINRMALASKGFSPGEIDDLIGYHPTDNPPPLPDLREIYGFPKTGKAANLQFTNDGEIKNAAAGFDLAWPIGVTASNNWVISGARTKSKKVLLANDPHLGLGAPSIWYLTHLSWEIDGKPINLIGASLPSIPLIMLGRNDDVAWGFTTSNLDSQDIYIERENPENENEYLTQSGWVKFGERLETIKISGKRDVEYKIRTTAHGPVLPAQYKNIEKYLPTRHVAALKWLAMSNNDTSMDALIAMARAGDVDGLIIATRALKSPMQSIVIGDRQGNIGFIAPARVAIRSPDNKIMGRAPVPGWLPQYEWQGFLDFEQLPQYKNPSSGILFSANSKFIDEDYAHHLTYDWSENFRRQRIQELIAGANSPHDMESMISGHGDNYSSALVEFRDEVFSQMQTGLSVDLDIVEAIRKWDGRMTKDAVEPLIIMSWFKQISSDLLKDDLGEDYKLFARGNITRILGILGTGGARDWCDNRKSPGRQDCSSIIIKSLKKSIDKLRAAFGDDWKSWRWGRAHIAFGQHRPFAKVPPLDKLFNVEIESEGGPYTLLRGQTDFREKENPFYNRHASSYRAIYDFSDLNNSLYIQTTGQSGNFLSKYYSNFAERWSDVKYLTISSDAKDYEKDAIGVWNVKRKK